MFLARDGIAFFHAAQVRRDHYSSHGNGEGAEDLDPLQPEPVQVGQQSCVADKSLHRKKQDEDKEYVAGENQRRVIAQIIRDPSHEKQAREATEPHSEVGGQVKRDAAMKYRSKYYIRETALQISERLAEDDERRWGEQNK